MPFKAYEKEILYDNLADISQLNSGSFVNNIPVKSVDGTKYFTDYIDATDETLCYKGDSANSGSGFMMQTKLIWVQLIRV